MDLDSELQKIARNLLKRPPLRRGPYLISDEALKRTIITLGGEK